MDFKYRIILFSFVLIALFMSETVQADEVILKDGQKIQGVVLSNTDKEVSLQIRSSWRVFSKAEVEEVVIWDQKKNDRMRSEWQLRGFGTRLVEAVRGGPSGIMRFLKPYHYRLMRWSTGTKVGKFLMQKPFFKRYKKENPIGFNLSVYCILILLLAFVLKVIKELIFLILSLFGYTTHK